MVYRLYQTDPTSSTTFKERKVATAILETKHIKNIDLKEVAQVMGYYCKAKGDCKENQSNVAILFNEFDGKFKSDFLFFYTLILKIKNQQDMESRQ